MISAIAITTGSRPTRRAGAYRPRAGHDFDGGECHDGAENTARLTQYPDLPAIAESLPGFLAGSWYGLAAPAGTPRGIVDRLSAETQKIFSDPEFRDKFLTPAMTFSIASPPDQFAARIRADLAKWGKVIKDAGVKVE